MISVHIRKELHSFHGDFSLAADFDSSARHMVLFGASGAGAVVDGPAISGLGALASPDGEAMGRCGRCDSVHLGRGGG